jgi:hypothetical protein
MMEGQIIQPEYPLAVLAIEIRRCVRSIHWLGYKAQVLTALRSFSPIWDVWVQVGQDKFYGTSWFGSDSRRPRRKTFGVCRCDKWGAGHTRDELCIQVFLDEWCWTSRAGAEVNICVARYMVIEGLVESAGDKLCGRSFL